MELFRIDDRADGDIRIIGIPNIRLHSSCGPALTKHVPESMPSRQNLVTSDRVLQLIISRVFSPFAKRPFRPPGRIMSKFLSSGRGAELAVVRARQN